MEADDRLCSRNARSQKALVGRAQWRIDPLPSLKRERASWQDTPLSTRFHPGQVKFKGSRGNQRAGVVLLSLPLHIVGGTAWLLEPVSRLCGFLSSRQGTQVALSAAVKRGPSGGRTFWEHWTHVGVLPIRFIVRALRARRAPGRSPAALASNDFARPLLGPCTDTTDVLGKTPDALAWVTIGEERSGLLLNLGGRPSW